ncbi:MAG: trypsin-like peptidase domain-containing protein [Nitrososphaerota archaeon]|nr:trypsin-like peptidase domain-containing protein [Nitrososphaerota archaeon]MDG7024750.1 trypsin-like peptidase domain-containing protein [Nitrososphaerota archaeon]
MVPFVKGTKDKDGKEKIGAAALGFLLSYNGTRYVVTAKHVVEDDEELGVSLGSKVVRPSETLAELGGQWIPHPDPEIDLAVLPIRRSLKLQTGFFLPFRFAMNSGEVNLGDDVIFGSLPYYTPIPIVLRRGMVAYTEDKGFLIDGQVFPGSSGSPVFLYKRPLRFAGIVVGYRPYEDVAISGQTGEVRAVYSENSGIGVVHTTDKLKELLDSKEFATQ